MKNIRFEGIRAITVREITRIALVTAVISLAVYVIPPLQLTFLPVPLTLQLLFVLLIGLVFPPREAFLSLFVYLIIGALGLPVFSGGRGGFDMILGPTGGFLLLFPLIAWLLSCFKKRVGNYFAILAAQIVLVYLVFYPLASLWLGWQTEQKWSIVMMTMIPFMFVDALKIILATSLYKSLARLNILRFD